MTKIVTGPDPLPGPLRTDVTWTTVGAGHELVWLDLERLLVWEPATARYRVYPYRRAEPATDKDPFDGPPTGQGDWLARELADHRLVYAGRRLLTWRPLVPDPRMAEPGKGTARFRLWRLDPGKPDPLGAGAPLAEGEWTTIGGVNQLLYIGPRTAGGQTTHWLLDWAPGATFSHYRVWGLNLDPGGKDPLSATPIALGNWTEVKKEHELIWWARDRLLVWSRATGHYRVYRIDREARGWDVALLPRTVLAEGTWDAFQGGGHRLLPIGGRAIEREPATGRTRIWEMNTQIPDRPDATEVAGVTVQRRAKDERPFLVVDVPALKLRTTFDTDVPEYTLRNVARELALDPAQAFEDILSMPEDDHALRALYLEATTKTAGPGEAGRAKAAAELRALGFRTLLTGEKKYAYKTDRRFEGWRTYSKGTWFTLTPAFRFVMLDAQKKAERDAHIRATKVQLAELRPLVDAVHLAVFRLQKLNELLEDLLRGALQGLSFLTMADGMLAVMLARPKEGFDASDRADVVALRARLATLIDETRQHMVAQPVRFAKEKKERDDAADALIALIADPKLIALSRVLAANLDVADPDLRQQAYEECAGAYTQLLHSHRADEVGRDHVGPAIALLASRVDPKDVPASGEPGLDAALAKAAADKQGDPKTWLGALADAAGPGLQLAGNAPGPPSLMVAIMGQFGAQIARFAYKNPLLGKEWSAKLFLAVCRTAYLEPADRTKLVVAVSRGKLAPIREQDWAKDFQTGPLLASVVAVLNFATLYAAVTKDEDDTLTKWTGILAAGAGSITGIQGLATAFARGGTLARIMGTGGPYIGAVGGIAAAIAGGFSAMERYQEGDKVGVWLNAAGALVGYGSTVAFIMAGGLSATATGFGSPVGLALMVFGVLLAAVSFTRGLLTADTHGVFATLLSIYEHGDKKEIVTGYLSAATLRKSLADALAAVKEKQHPNVFTGYMRLIDVGAPEPTSPDPTRSTGGAELLHDLGFSSGLIAAATGVAASAIEARLVTTRPGGPKDGGP